MYEKHFGLSRRPFDLAPDPAFLYESDQHARAIANLKFSLLNRDSFVVLTGGIGVGKTTVLNSVLQDLGQDYVRARLTHTTLDNVELIQALLSEFGAPLYTKNRVKLLDTLRARLLQYHQRGQHVVIIVDEAQKLSAPALEELRLISCIDTSDRRIVTIILTGNVELDEKLDTPELAQLRQRTRLRQMLAPLNDEQAKNYIAHRLAMAGGDVDEIFSANCIAEVNRLSAGTPRLINTLCDTAMMACYVSGAHQVDLATLRETAEELGWDDTDDAARQLLQGARPVGRPNPDHAYLSVFEDGRLVDQASLSHLPFLIGRSKMNDLVLHNPSVSRRHAMIDRISDLYVVDDLNSKNGIAVNRESQSHALLKEGDVITIGNVDLAFETGYRPAIHLEKRNQRDTARLDDIDDSEQTSSDLRTHRVAADS
jgi:type II secretory pathway predicted ATPase ExeA